MKVCKVLTLNRELLKRFHAAGIKPEDYKYLDLYNDYNEAVGRGEKVTYIVATLAARYEISERQVYNLVARFGREVKYCNLRAVE